VRPYTVPAGVTSIQAVVAGAEGGLGDGRPDAGGAGTLVTGTLPASPGEQFGVVTGCGGSTNGGLGYGNGGKGGANSGGGGGGASAVLSAPKTNATPLVVAGGAVALATSCLAAAVRITPKPG
jgi:hypothetical protein